MHSQFLWPSFTKPTVFRTPVEPILMVCILVYSCLWARLQRYVMCLGMRLIYFDHGPENRRSGFIVDIFEGGVMQMSLQI